MKNYLVVLLLSVLVLLGAFYENIVGQRIVKIKDEMEKLQEPIDTLRKEMIETNNAYRKETDQMKETMTLLEEKVNAYRKEKDQMKETMKLLEEKDNAHRKETDQMKETMKLLEETATRHENTLSASKKAEKLCSQGWEEYKGHCYQFNTKQNNWYQAEFECIKQKGYLLKIEDANEFRWIVARATAYSLDDIWIGLRKDNNEWRWVVDDQTARFQKWNNGEPSGDGPCVHMFYPYMYNWNDVTCSRQCSFICEQRRG